jgi:hypothetical protein
MRTALVSPLIEYFLANDFCRAYDGVQGDECSLVELNINNRQVQEPIYFNSDSSLDGDNCIITGIEVITSNQLTNTPSAGELNGTSSLANAILYIANLDREIIAEVPLSTFSRSLNGGKLRFTNFTGHVWQNCYIKLFTAQGATPTLSILLNVYSTPLIKE